jgi:hypothetical protein
VQPVLLEEVAARLAVLAEQHAAHVHVRQPVVLLAFRLDQVIRLVDSLDQSPAGDAGLDREKENPRGRSRSAVLLVTLSGGHLLRQD